MARHDLMSSSIEAWLESLASDAPTPGGGAAAGVVAAHGVALLQMVCAFTPALSDLHEQLSTERARMLALGQADMDAFGAVSAAYGLPKHDEASKRARADAIQAGLRGAMQAPLDTIDAIFEAMRPAEQVVEAANPNVASDAGIGLVMLRAAADAAFYNVRINARFARDKQWAAECLERATDALAQIDADVERLRGQLEPHIAPRS